VAPRRGEVWTVEGGASRIVLVVSGNLYNNLPDHLFVLAMEVVSDVTTEIAAVGLRGDQFAVIDTIGRVPKQRLGQRLYQVDVQTLTDVDNWLFKILATS
jgi:mRNA-degrading endonuclease toxin of MazEF toxin-antitoxin module